MRYVSVLVHKHLAGKQWQLPERQTTVITEPFHYQLTHTTLKKAELLKHSKLDKNAPTCFGLHRNHLQLERFYLI